MGFKQISTGVVGLLTMAVVGACSASSTAGTAVTSSQSASTSGQSTMGTGSSVAGSLAPVPLRSNLARGTGGAAAGAGRAMDSLGAALLRQMPAGDNAVLSPYSIYAVLAMTRDGAKGATAAQLDKVLGGTAAVQGGNVTAVDRAVAAAIASGGPPTDADPQTADVRPVTLDVANSVWLSPSLTVRKPYLDALATKFGVGMYQLDYRKDPEQARKIINGWVANHTRDKITDLLQKEQITADTLIALVNAVYLSAPWASDFRRSSTPLPFSTASGAKKTVPAMQVSARLETASGKGWTSVTIPYRGDGLAMTLVIPDAGSFDSVRADLASVLPVATSGRSTAVDLTMPTFDAEAHLSLVPAMKALGVTDLFDPKAADLSGIAGGAGDIYAGHFVHQTVVSVDEKGTEATAATAIVGMPSGAAAPGPSDKISVDRPFFYTIHDTTTGAALFLGQITDPKS
ncbi:serpin B [Nakamurella sp. UYEF19]|uniref:serpin family protein n=1 Tax=Nakamurella sp. UYEF19 TaxID=1756392 RepID=UPI00339641B7